MELERTREGKAQVQVQVSAYVIISAEKTTAQTHLEIMM